ncbi:MAG: Flp family type IVb pilin [Phycisphaeraceae bacterium]|jgi:Flp pilus assembly pilin Flp
MTKMLTNMKEAVLELWNDEQGAEGLEKVLIIAAIALPLLAVLLFFSGEIRDWVSDNWESVGGTSQDENDVDDNPF